MSKPELFLVLNDEIVKYFTYEEFEVSEYIHMLGAIPPFDVVDNCCIYLFGMSDYLINYKVLKEGSHPNHKNYFKQKSMCIEYLRNEGMQDLFNNI